MKVARRSWASAVRRPGHRPGVGADARPQRATAEHGPCPPPRGPRCHAERISSDPRLANTPELRRIALDGDTVTLDASETWHGRYLLDSQLNLTKIPADDPLSDSVQPAHSSVLAS